MVITGYYSEILVKTTYIQYIIIYIYLVSFRIDFYFWFISPEARSELPVRFGHIARSNRSLVSYGSVDTGHPRLVDPPEMGKPYWGVAIMYMTYPW